MSAFRTAHFVCVALLSAGPAMAQGRGAAFPAGAAIAGNRTTGPVTTVAAPLFGYFFDAGGTQLRSIVGIPGSGFPGAAIALGSGATSIEVSPAQDYALAILPRSGELARIPFDQATPAPEPVVGAMDGISRIAISPTGSAAVIYSESTRRAQVFTGFPNAPALAHEFDWSTLPGLVTAMTVDDAGDLALVAVQSTNAALYAVSETGGFIFVYSAQSIPSLAFLRNSREALAAAPAEKQVIWIHDNSGSPNPTILASESAGIAGPQAVAASQDGSRAFVVDAAAAILAIPFSGAPPIRATCSCQPSRLQRMRGRDVFLLTASLDAPLAVLDAGAESLGVILMAAPPPQAVVVSGEKKR